MVIAPGLIVQLGIIQGTHRLGHIHGELHAAAGFESDDGGAFRASFGSDEDDAVGPVHTINGQLGGILEDGHRLNFLGRNVVDKITFHLKSIHIDLECVHIRGRGVGAYPANHHPGASVTGGSVVVNHHQTGILTGKLLGEVGQVLGISLEG